MSLREETGKSIHSVARSPYCVLTCYNSRVYVENEEKDNCLRRHGALSYAVHSWY